MILQEMFETFRRAIGNDKPYVASKGAGRWTIRHYDPLLRRWTDSGQLFFNKHDADMRLKRDLLNKRAG